MEESSGQKRVHKEKPRETLRKEREAEQGRREAEFAEAADKKAAEARGRVDELGRRTARVLKQIDDALKL